MLERVLEQLRAEGYLQGDTGDVFAEADAGHDLSPWVLALQMAGGWLSALFLLLFLGVGAAPLIDSAEAWFVVGVLIIGATGALMGRKEVMAGSPVWRQFLLVASLAGHGALLVGTMETSSHERGIALAMVALFESFMLLWVRWMPHRIVSALMFGGCLLVSFNKLLAPEFAAFWPPLYWAAVSALWLSESRWQASFQSEALYALATGLMLVVLGGSLGLFLDFSMPLRGIGAYGGVYPLAAVCAVNVISLAVPARPALTAWNHVLAAVLMLAVIGLTWRAPAIGMGMLVLLFGFARGHRWLLALGGVVLVWGVGRFYYDLQLTLLDKSGLMVLGGVLLLSVRWLVGLKGDQK
ncbi:DUF4401 domain-containing protein [Propionivibrio limicola]|uniref:DUF4401 domain-containing protein n=1 Tax=Propionivibrio limicola TaxID=167645 RepID=UPI001292937F|nr:DUF4401 domain-containing protein [Propionivibrio limicola]